MGTWLSRFMLLTLCILASACETTSPTRQQQVLIGPVQPGFSSEENGRRILFTSDAFIRDADGVHIHNFSWRYEIAATPDAIGHVFSAQGTELSLAVRSKTVAGQSLTTNKAGASTIHVLTFVVDDHQQVWLEESERISK